MDLIKTNSIVKVYEHGVFDNVNSVSDIEVAIASHRDIFQKEYMERFNITNPSSITPSIQKLFNKESNTIAGGIFEIFVMGYCILRGKTDDSFLLDNVVSTDIVTKDMGIDIYAKTTDKNLIVNGRPNVNIQVKYTSNRNKKFNFSELSTFMASAKKHIPDAAGYFSNMIFVNFGSGVNHNVKSCASESIVNGISGNMRVISRNHFEKKLQKPGSFFDELRDLIERSAKNVMEHGKSSLTFESRDFQNEVIDEVKINLDKDDKTTVIVPTGGGKTVIGARLISDMFAAGGKIAVVMAPTIILTNQFSNFLRDCFGTECEYLRICSEIKKDEGSLHESVTLYDDEIKLKLFSSMFYDEKLIVVVTYRSYDKFFSIMKNLGLSADLGIFDEAHHIVHGGSETSSPSGNWTTFKKIEDNKLCDKMVMFTATPYFDPSITYENEKYCPPKHFPIKLKDSASMNNIFRFGKLVVVPTKRVLDEGYIIPTNLMFRNSETTIPGLDKNYVKNVITTVCDKIDSSDIASGDKMKRPTVDEIYTVIFSMDELYNEVKKYNNDNKVKLIYPAASTTIAHALNHILTEVFSSLDVDLPIFKEEIYIDSMSSDVSQMNAYSKMGTREDIISEMEKDKHCIVIHYDMLSEGVNIPSVTGILLGRNMNATKSVQTNGRAVRLDPHDAKLVKEAHQKGKKNIFSPKNKTFREKVMNKPYAYFIIQVSGTIEQQLTQIREYFKIYTGTTDFTFGEVSYSTPGKFNETEDDKNTCSDITSEIEHIINSIPKYSFESEEFSTYLPGTVEDYEDIDFEIEPEEINPYGSIDLTKILTKGEMEINPMDYGLVDISKSFDMMKYLNEKYSHIETSMKIGDTGNPVIHLKIK